MNKLVFGGVAFVAFTSASAWAADIAPVYRPAPAAVLATNWSGLYVGGNAGYAWTKTDIDYRQSPGAAGGFGDPFAISGLNTAFQTTPGSFVGGAQIGYNYQFGAMVAGLEGDFAWGSASGTEGRRFATFGDQLTLNTEQTWVATIRGRLGFTPASTWLVYVTGGLAVGRLNDQFTQAVVAPPASIGSRTAGNDGTEWGWTLGAGSEFAFSNAWSLGVEYLYVDLGTRSLSLPAQAVSGVPYAATTTDFSHTSHFVRLKLNYHFN